MAKPPRGRSWYGCVIVLAATQVLHPQTGAPVAQHFNLPLTFEENRGQSGSEVRFLARASQYSAFFTDRGVTIAGGNGSETVKMSVTSAGPGTRVHGENRLSGKVNYFCGSDRGKWLTDLATYGKLRYAEIYPGIDLVYHANGQQIEFDFDVAPQADPKQIRLHLSGPANLRLNQAGDLLAGPVVFHKPAVYQVVDGNRIPVAAAFRIVDSTNAGFSLDVYDSSKALVIDPTLAYATYIGPASESEITGVSMGVDGSGNAYIAGSTNSINVPVTEGALQTGVATGKNNLTGFVAKLNPSGTGLVYATYLGGEGQDALIGMAVDATGSAYVVGETTSRSFPISKSAYQTTCSAYCGFVSKLSPDGSSLIYSTYLGNKGSGIPMISAIAVNAAGNAYLTGYTNGQPFPTTSGAFQTSGAASGFVAELDVAGTSLVYSTLLGGTTGTTIPTAIALDRTGNAYVTGMAGGGFPITPGAYQTASGGGFLSKVAPLGTRLIYSTLMGSSGDTPSSVAVDAAGNAYVAGFASSSYPTTSGAFQTKGGGIFVTKFNPNGSGVVYSTFVNAHGTPSGFLPQLAIDASGHAYVTGLAGANLPLTSDALHVSGSGSFLTVLDPAGLSAIYSTYTGGDEGTAIALDNAGSVYIAGAAASTSTTVPVTGGAFQPKPGNGSTAFVMKIAFSPVVTPSVSDVVNAAGAQPGIVPGSYATIFGSNLSPVTDSWNNSIGNGSLPVSLDGVSVSVGGTPAYVNYVSPGQINFLAPDVPSGPVSITVATPSGTSSAYASSASVYGPGFFLLPGNQPVATHLDYTFAAKNGTYPGFATVPARPGETIILWGTGFGPTTPDAPVGILVPSSQTYSTTVLPSITISTLPAQVYGAVLSPGFAGLYQIAIQIPNSLANGDWPVLAAIGGMISQTGVLLTVQF
jgi:uncharacterized protein (TIGR03437 family)